MKIIALVILASFSTLAFGQETAQVTAHANDYVSMAERILALFGAGGVLAMFIPPKVRATIPLANMVLRFIRLEFLGQKRGAPDQDKDPAFR